MTIRWSSRYLKRILSCFFPDVVESDFDQMSEATHPFEARHEEDEEKKEARFVVRRSHHEMPDEMHEICFRE